MICPLSVIKRDFRSSGAKAARSLEIVSGMTSYQWAGFILMLFLMPLSIRLTGIVLCIMLIPLVIFGYFFFMANGGIIKVENVLLHIGFLSFLSFATIGFLFLNL
jgi:hypothetical protein